MKTEDLIEIHTSTFSAPYQNAIGILKELKLDQYARKEIAENGSLSFGKDGDTIEQAAVKAAASTGWNDCLEFIFNLYKVYPNPAAVNIEPEMTFNNEEE